jgi:hypothetical protein
MIGSDQPRVHRMESGDLNITYDKLISILTTLNVPVVVSVSFNGDAIIVENNTNAPLPDQAPATELKTRLE